MIKRNKKKMMLLLKAMFGDAQYIKDNGSDIWIIGRTTEKGTEGYRIQISTFTGDTIKRIMPEYKIKAEKVEISEDGQKILERIECYAGRK